MIYVLTRSHEQFRAFCIDAKTSHNNPNFKFVSRERDLRGIRNFPLIRYGQYWMHPEYVELERMLPTLNPISIKLTKGEENEH